MSAFIPSITSFFASLYTNIQNFCSMLWSRVRTEFYTKLLPTVFSMAILLMLSTIFGISTAYIAIFFKILTIFM
ncbi:hypothetical protein BDC45DRAFT_505623 [Circinella umbellata]|nr:hypothetical protein BDC45DRAFT_505623 [Circinella umbellata]